MFKYPITITLDTNYFESTKYDLTDDSTLRLLQSYVKDGKIKVVLSDIVVREVGSHFTRYVKAMMKEMKSSRKDYLGKIKQELWVNAGAKEYIFIPIGDDIANKMIDIFTQYLKDIDAEIIKTEDVNIQEILDDYFSFSAPFENNDKKRKEFPDAFIASQIRASFPELDSLVIISNDTGFKKACNKKGEYLCFNSLGDLYDAINKENALYNKIIETLKLKEAEIDEIVKKEIEDSENIIVDGQTYDRKGVVYGHEYSETYLESIKNMTHHLHIVEDIEGDEAIVTLVGHCNIDMDCYYEDYDNAPWDGEKKEYVYVNTVHVLEKHQPNFAFRIRINIKSGEIKLLPLHLYLGGDSRKEIITVEDTENFDEMDFLNKERKNLGLQALDEYEDFVEESLRKHKINEEIPKMLNDYYNSCSALEDCANSCDWFLECLEKDENIEETINALEEKLQEYNFNYIELPDDYTKDEVESWLNRIIVSCDIYEEISIPEELELNKEYSIKGMDNTLVIGIDDLYTENLSEGDEESADIYAEDDNNEKVHGTIEFKVGYQHFDEDMCATDGEEDEVAIEYSEIKLLIERFISDQEEILKDFQSLEEVLCEFYDDEE